MESLNANLEVLFSPAEFDALSGRDLSQTTCVVLDVLRATSSMITALANGAKSIVPVATISQALDLHKQDPQVLLAGERNGLRITQTLTGSLEFDFGNSPREFTRDKVQGRRIVVSTTNGTRALQACDRAKLVLVGSLLNLTATANYLLACRPERLLIVCGGTFEQAAYEDTLVAGALSDLVWETFQSGQIADSAMF